MYVADMFRPTLRVETDLIGLRRGWIGVSCNSLTVDPANLHNLKESQGWSWNSYPLPIGQVIQVSRNNIAVPPYASYLGFQTGHNELAIMPQHWRKEGNY
jgi:hypothetical protein